MLHKHNPSASCDPPPPPWCPTSTCASRGPYPPPQSHGFIMGSLCKFYKFWPQGKHARFSIERLTFVSIPKLAVMPGPASFWSTPPPPSSMVLLPTSPATWYSTSIYRSREKQHQWLLSLHVFWMLLNLD